MPSTDDWVQRTARWSLAAQVVLGIVGISAFAHAEVYDRSILLGLLILDTTVQVVEFLFYVAFVRIGVPDVKYRYLDWFVTTPTMLVSAIVFFAYLRDGTLTGFFDRHAGDAILIVTVNACMLIFGLGYELARGPPSANLGPASRASWRSSRGYSLASLATPGQGLASGSW